MIRAVVFDVGETLLDDTAEWGRWADWIGVPRHTFSAVLGALGALGKDNGKTFEYFRPGFDLQTERQAREAAGLGEHIREEDLYPDVRSTLAELKAKGFWVGVSGNQSARTGELLRDLDLGVDAVATSGELGVVKPDKEFWDRIIAWAGVEPGEILYVGDHKDYDIHPAHAAGLRTALVRRGPWGHLWSEDPEVRATADWIVHSLRELPELVEPPAPGGRRGRDGGRGRGGGGTS